MKKLYIGLGVSFALIIGGVAYGSVGRPTVNMAKIGNIFYSDWGHHKIPKNNKVEYKLISLNDDAVKMRIDFKDYSGIEDLTNLMAWGYHEKSDISSEDKKAIEKFFDDVHQGKDSSTDKKVKKYTKTENINYKWVEKPLNMSLTKAEEKTFKNKYGNDSSYTKFNVLQENGEVPLSGSVEIKRPESQGTRLKVNGIKGSGVLEVEYKVTY